MRAAAPPHRRATIVLLAAMLVVHNAQRMAVVSLFDALRGRFATDYAGVGALFAAYVVGYALFQTVVGLVGDRFDAKRLLLSGLLLSAVFSALFARTRTYELALVTRFLLGASGALLYTPAMKLGITLFSRHERGRVLGMVQAGAGLGIVGALTLVPFAVEQIGTAGGFLTLPAFTLAVLLPAARVLPGAAQTSAPIAAAGGATLGRRADFWQLVLVNFAGMLASYGLLTWLPTYLTRTFGYSAVEAGSLASVSNVTLLVVAPLVGVLADLPRGRTGVLLGGSALACGCYLALVATGTVTMTVIVAILMGASLAATTAPMMLFAGERFGPQETARVVALLSTAAQLGAALAGVVFGAILARWDRFGPIWIACALLAGLRLALLLRLLAQDRLALAAAQRLAHGD